jgi:putative ABC transport system ATP-binding protein
MSKASMNPAYIELDKITKTMSGRRVLDSISFTIQPRKILAVIGPSGSGKSTLLRTMNRLIEIDSGNILISGTPIKKHNIINLRRKIGLVAQTPAMFSGTVLQNIRYGLDLHNKYNKDTIIKAVKDSELTLDFLYRDASKLSLGEQQRVAIARALALEPEILLLDEPTAALDNKITLNFEETIRHLISSRGLTIIWVTHDLAQARRVGDSAAVLKRGKLDKFGSVSQVLQKKPKRIKKSKGGGK